MKGLDVLLVLQGNDQCISYVIYCSGIGVPFIEIPQR